MSSTTNTTTSPNAPTDGHIEGYDFGSPPPLGNPIFGQIVGVGPPVPLDPPIRNYRANSLAQPFNLKERLKVKGKPLLGFGLFLGSPSVARIVGGGGYDFVFIDWEHSPMSIREVTELIRWVQYSSEGNTAVIVRLPAVEHYWIAWILDAGASGIILPHTETVEEAKAMVAAAKFPNGGGKRSFPPAALSIGINDGAPNGKLPFDVWNNAAIIMQVETVAGCANAEAIAAVDGVDCIMIGHADLRLDLGLYAAMDGPEDVYNNCVKQVLSGKKAGKPLMTLTQGPGQVEKRLNQGFEVVMVGNDAFVLGGGMREILNNSYKEMESWKKDGSRKDFYEREENEAQA